MSRDKLANDLLTEFAKYFAHESLPRLGTYPTDQAFQIYQNDPLIKAKADMFTASVMEIVDKHMVYVAPTQPKRECPSSPRADGEHEWVTQTSNDLLTAMTLLETHCKFCGERQQ